MPNGTLTVYASVAGQAAPLPGVRITVRDESGALLAEYAQPDGIHLTVSGYTAWVDYLCTHVPYDKNNPYQPGSAWYLDAGLKDLIADIP